MNLDFFTKDDKTGEASDTTKRAWLGFGFILLVGLILICVMLFTKVNEQVISFFQFLASLLGLTGPGAYSLKRVTEKKESSAIPKEEIKDVITGNKESVLIDGIEYNSQRDNRHRPSGSCNVTSLQMMVQKFSKDHVTDDQLWEVCNSNETKKWALEKVGSWVSQYIKNDTLNQVHAVLAYSGNKFVNPDYHILATSNLNEDRIKKSLDNGFPVLVGVKSTTSGHIVLIIGYNKEGFIVNDPWGNWNVKYKNFDGEKVVYSYQNMKKLLSGNGLVIS